MISYCHGDHDEKGFGLCASPGKEEMGSGTRNGGRQTVSSLCFELHSLESLRKSLIPSLMKEYPANELVLYS